MASDDASDAEQMIKEHEVTSLNLSNRIGSVFESTRESGVALCEDIYSCIYHDLDEERVLSGPWDDVLEKEDHALRTALSVEELEARAHAQRSEGLRTGICQPFSDVSVRIDDVNDTFAGRFLVEANHSLYKVAGDIISRGGKAWRGAQSKNRVNL